MSATYSVRCVRCAARVQEDPRRLVCPTCSGPLDFTYGDSPFPPAAGASMWKYRDLLPVGPQARIVSLDEGVTPLRKARSFGPAEVFLKDETRNPTGSHKDRALSVGVTKALEFGRDAVMLFSDGSTALSSAAYAARAGLKSITVFGRGIPEFRLLPLMIYGSHLLEYQGSQGEALDWVHEACRKLGIFEVSTYRLANPYVAEAPRTIGFEIFEQLGRAPDWVVVPVGGGGTMAGIWRAFVELRERGLVSKPPRIAGVLPADYVMLRTALERGVKTERDLRALAPAEPPPTVQAKVAMTYAPDGLEAISAVRDSGGLFLDASDGESLEAQKKLGALDGIYAEPSATIAAVGVEKLLGQKRVGEGETVVAVVTGSGFRETGALSGRVELKRVPIKGDAGLSALEKIVGR